MLETNKVFFFSGLVSRYIDVNPPMTPLLDVSMRFCNDLLMCRYAHQDCLVGDHRMATSLGKSMSFCSSCTCMLLKCCDVLYCFSFPPGVLSGLGFNNTDSWTCECEEYYCTLFLVK